MGRPFTLVGNGKGRVVGYRIDPVNATRVDFSRKQHSFIIAKSGGGKSYLAGVYAEELARVMENYAVVILDPMGIFSTLSMPNTNEGELDAWNEQVPRDVVPGAVANTRVWVPAGDARQFLPGTFDQEFSMRAPEFSHGTLCYAFDLDPLSPQVNLYRKCQNLLLAENAGYTLQDLIGYIKENGQDSLGFSVATVEALTTKLDALAELGIITKQGPALHDVVREGCVAVFDLSLSSMHTARIIVNFFAEKLLLLRRQITRMVTEAKVKETQIEKPAWYVPPIQLVLDESHNFMPGNTVLKRCIKEGRNCAFMMTCISQSPDLTRDVYANISHLWVGPLVYDDDIAAVRAMLPIETPLKEFRQKVRALETGSFLYYNIETKQETLVRVRPRRTLHPASTELRDERKYFKQAKAGSIYTLKFARAFTKLHEPAFSTIRVGTKPVQEGDVINVVHPDGRRFRAEVLLQQQTRLDQLPDEFLMADTDTSSRRAAIDLLREFYPRLAASDHVHVLRVRYIDQPGAMV